MLEISPEKVVHIIYQFREGNVADEELHAFIDALNDDEKAHLTAIAWVGRGAFDPEDYEAAVQTAYTEATVPTDQYLMGMPHLAENLEADRIGVDDLVVADRVVVGGVRGVEGVGRPGGLGPGLHLLVLLGPSQAATV